MGALFKFRSGTAPIAIETGRYSGVNIDERKCFSCKDIVEDETHVLLHCPQYTSLRNELFTRTEHVSHEFSNLNDSKTLAFILSNPFIAKLITKICHLILNILLYSS